MLIISGFLLHGAFLLNISQDFYVLPPIIAMLGAFISLIPVTINPKAHSHMNRLWIILGIIPIALGLYIALLFVFYIDTLSLTILVNGIVILLFLSLAVYRIVIIINTEQDSSVNIPLNILDMFTKPPSLSKKDLLFNKEKQLCLVCKSQIQGYIYMCPQCKALYCSKCSISLSNIENTCWVCNSAIDTSKPVKELQEIEKMVNTQKRSKKTVKLFSDKRMLKHIFDDNVSAEEEQRSLGIIKLTIISDEELDEIESLGMKEKEQEDFLKEMVYFPPNERKLIIDDISDKLNMGEKQN